MKLKTFLQYCVSHHLLSRIFAYIARCRCAWVKNLIIKWFCGHYKVDLSDAAEPELNKYSSFNDFFTRELKPEARPIAPGENSVISPVDGTVSQIGSINGDSLIQAKRFKFTLSGLLANQHVERFIDGDFATLYLSPADYHRIHMPYPGRLRKVVYIPGRLFSVASSIVNEVPNLYSRNERVVAFCDTDVGTMALVLVGAIFVAGIETVWAGDITPNRGKTVQVWGYDKEQFFFERGAEIGRFKFGSTVIALFPKDVVGWNKRLKPESKVLMGGELAKISNEFVLKK